MTHGDILVRGIEDGTAFPLHTWNDGHASQAFLDCLALPFYLIKKFEAIDGYAWVWDKCKANYYRDEDESPLYFFRFTPTEQNRDEVQNWFVSMTPFHTCDMAISNWLSQIYFNRWHLIANSGWTKSYYKNCIKSPDVLVETSEPSRRLVTYMVSLPGLEKNDPESHQKILEDAKKYIDEQNQKLSKNAQYKIIENKIYVPFDQIIIDLCWEQIQKSQKNAQQRMVDLVQSGKVSKEELASWAEEMLWPKCFQSKELAMKMLESGINGVKCNQD